MGLEGVQVSSIKEGFPLDDTHSVNDKSDRN